MPHDPDALHEMSELHLSERCAVTISRALGMVVVGVYGEVTGDDATLVSRFLVDLIQGQGNLDVVVDLKRVDALDEDGVAALEAARHSMDERGGRLALGNLSPVAATTLDRSGRREEFEVVQL